MNGLTSTEICQILESAGKAGVKHFAYGDLEFVMGGEVALTPASVLYQVENDANMYDNNTEEDIADTKEDVNIEELALSDPLQYEKLMYGEE